MTDVECLGVGFGLLGSDLFGLGGDFVAVVLETEIEDLEMEVGAVVRLVWDSLDVLFRCLGCTFCGI